MKNPLTLASIAWISLAVGAFASKDAGTFSAPTVCQRFENVRTTAYSAANSENGGWGGKNAINQPLKSGKISSAAADWSRWPLGTHFRIVETGREYIVDDIGSAMVGTGTIDLFKSTRSNVSRWGVRHVTIEILEWGSPEKSLKVLKPRARLSYIRKMVHDLTAAQDV